jgi:hypothetical protein
VDDVIKVALEHTPVERLVILQDQEKGKYPDAGSSLSTPPEV